VLQSGHWIAFRALFAPFWAAWVLALLLGCAKDRSERMVGSMRDLLYMFLLFVAFKVRLQP
jgi:hypothetical protein